MADLYHALLDWLREVFVDQFSFWIMLGFTAQFLFMMRFVVQWVASERARRSVMPVAFWFFSLAGGILLLIYAIHRRDPVFIAGQTLGLIVYIRNLSLIRAAARAERSRD